MNMFFVFFYIISFVILLNVQLQNLKDRFTQNVLSFSFIIAFIYSAKWTFCCNITLYCFSLTASGSSVAGCEVKCN